MNEYYSVGIWNFYHHLGTRKKNKLIWVGLFFSSFHKCDRNKYVLE